MVLSVGSSLSRSTPAATVHRLKITLRSVRPPVWRRIEVRSDVALDEFSGLLEAAMGWWGYHLHSFEVDGAVYERPYPDDWLRRETHDESEHRVGDVLGEVGARMCWDYDFGDGWQHDIEVEAIELADPGATYPRCVAGRRACPPEDCGGPWGYGELLGAIADERHPRHVELIEWLPSGWDPAHFDPAESTRSMLTRRPFADDW